MIQIFSLPIFLIKRKMTHIRKKIDKAFDLALLRDSLRCQSHLTIEERRVLFKLATNKSQIVEIGSYQGASACCFAAAPNPSLKSIYCIDTWTNEGMTEGPRDTWMQFRKNTIRYSSKIIPLRGWSVDVADQLLLYTTKIDLLFIDGAHDFMSVKADWDHFKGFLDIGSIVIFHDIGWAEGVKSVITREVDNCTDNHGSLPNMWWGTIVSKP
ncbi:MAG: class I SAM-dependent methyltransferase [Cyanobacteria bacterium K_Offshore_surface_m2_239]|nr:class I SAM-dependent methyltransferase [Cyanobacteria bacterium K_Offshore_surface_m2_239]